MSLHKPLGGVPQGCRLFQTGVPLPLVEAFVPGRTQNLVFNQALSPGLDCLVDMDTNLWFAQSRWEVKEEGRDEKRTIRLPIHPSSMFVCVCVCCSHVLLWLLS